MTLFGGKTFPLFTIFIGLMLASSLVHAQYPDLAGTWIGSGKDDTASCPNPADEDIGTFSLSIVFSNQSGPNFNVSLTSTENGITELETGSGFFTSPSTLQFTIVATGGFGTDTTNVNGNISGNSISFTYSGSNVGGDLCSWTGSGSVLRSTADIIVNPVITPSSTITEAVLFNTQIQGTILDVSNHITDTLNGRRFFGGPRIDDNRFRVEGATGLNSGDDSAILYGIWGNYSYSNYENDLSSTAFDGISHSFLGGVDFAFWKNTVLGVAFGYENGDIDTTFNRGNVETDSYTIVPYFGALLSDTFSIDLNVGYSRVDYDQFRTLPGTTTKVTSSPDSDRLFGALNLNGVTYHNDWVFGGRVGILWAENVINRYVESNGDIVAESRTNVSTGSVAGDVAYNFQNYEPFLNLSYQYDFSLTEIAVLTGPQPSNDRDDILMKVGVRYFENNGISGNLEYSKRFDRDDFDEDRISLTIRADF